MPYTLTTPWRWETWGADYTQFTPYARLAGRPITGGSITGTINPFLTDIPRGYTFIVNGTTVTTEQTHWLLLIHTILAELPIQSVMLKRRYLLMQDTRSTLHNYDKF
jgi:hypothetical protein